MTQSEISGLKQLIKTYLPVHADLNHGELAQFIMLDNPDIYISLNSIRRYVSLLREEMLLDQDTDDEDTSKATPEDILTPLDSVTHETIMEDLEAPLPIFDTDTVTGDEITLAHNKQAFDVSRLVIDRVYCAYSRKGLNLTGPATQSLFDIKPELFHAITYRLGLTKESKPYSDHTRAALSDGELYEYLEGNASFILDMLHKQDGTVTTQVIKSYKEALIKMNNQELLLNKRFDELKVLLPEIRISDFSKVNVASKGVLHVIIPDMHIGLDQDNYSLAIVKQKLEEVLSYIEDSQRVHVSFLGDIIHSVSGLNHPDSWKNMDVTINGANAIIKPFELLLGFLANVNGLERVNIVGGNHDRIQSAKKDENTGEGAKLLAYMLDNSLTDVNVVFDANYVLDDDDPDIALVILHGDNPVDKKPVQDIAWSYGNTSKFTYVSTGHLHSRKQDPKEDGLHYRKNQMPAFCPLDNYGKTVDTGSLPGFQTVYATKDGLPLVIDIPLHYD